MINGALRPLKDDGQAGRLVGDAERIVDDSVHFRHEWLAESGWVVIPVESGSHFTPEQSSVLSEAIRNEGCEAEVAVPTELDFGPLPAFRVEASPAGLAAFSYECGAYNYILLPPSLEHAVLCTTADYYLIGGTAEFVTAATGRTAREARRDFESYIELHFPALRPGLRGVLERYTDWAR